MHTLTKYKGSSRHFLLNRNFVRQKYSKTDITKGTIKILFRFIFYSTTRKIHPNNGHPKNRFVFGSELIFKSISVN